MFSSSTQNKFWTFQSQEEFLSHREEAWNKYTSDSFEDRDLTKILTVEEQTNLVDYYVCFVRDLCNMFQPAPPPTVFGTAAIYFKRFYLNTSPMEYHPREVAYLSVYLATKVDEYNVSISQFIQQLAPKYEKVQDFIITNELLLMQKLHFHLTVHNSFRPMEGFIIDLKARFRDLTDIDKFRQNAETFIIKALHADTFFIYTPSQIALAALKASIGNPLEDYIENTIGQGADTSKLLSKLDQIINMVKVFKMQPKDVIDKIITKLEICRSQEHNPLSEHYRANEMFAQEQREKAKDEMYKRLQESKEDNISGIDLMIE